MKFHINKIILWLKNGKIREIEFKPNKINVITGDSNTGKTAILGIIDYCFFASSPKISESIINENIEWYGLLLNINDKVYTVARKSIIKGKASNEYYFSSMGEIPEVIKENNTDSIIKSILETEFSIDKTVTFPMGYGSNNIKVGSKISMRYFLMFNTMSVNIIENDQGVFFDKQNESRYRDALPRIFDIATGIETIKNILTKEKKNELEKELTKLQRKEKAIQKQVEFFILEQGKIVKKAKEYSLINASLSKEEGLAELEKVINGLQIKSDDKNNREKLEKQRNLLIRKIKNLNRFTTEYTLFKENLSNIGDSLKPIDFLTKESINVVQTSLFKEIIQSLTSDLENIRQARKQKTPLNKQVNDEILTMKKELETINKELSLLPKNLKSFENEKEKYFFLGEVKSKLQLYSNKKQSPKAVTQKKIQDLEKKIDSLKIDDTEDIRNLTIKLIEEIISDYIEISGTALENYSNYLPVFDYKNKALLLRKPKTSHIEIVGSSSNHLFLHLFFTLAMHEIIFTHKSPYVAPFIIIDQPSRPYYGSGENKKEYLNHSDEFKIQKAFKLLDSFVEERLNNDGEFQVIVFEHIPKSLISDFKHIHIVEEFWNGNALIPKSML